MILRLQENLCVIFIPRFLYKNEKYIGGPYVPSLYFVVGTIYKGMLFM